ncbi:MAG: DUF4339 domain-containing protein [Pirellulales bacterium]
MTKLWFTRILGEVTGPMTPEEIRRLAVAMHLGPDDEVRYGADGEWIQARLVQGLFRAQSSKRTPSISEVVRKAAAMRNLELDIDVRRLTLADRRDSVVRFNRGLHALPHSLHFRLALEDVQVRKFSGHARRDAS